MSLIFLYISMPYVQTIVVHPCLLSLSYCTYYHPSLKLSFLTKSTLTPHIVCRLIISNMSCFHTCIQGPPVNPHTTTSRLSLENKQAKKVYALTNTDLSFLSFPNAPRTLASSPVLWLTVPHGSICLLIYFLVLRVFPFSKFTSLKVTFKLHFPHLGVSGIKEKWLHLYSKCHVHFTKTKACLDCHVAQTFL